MTPDLVIAEDSSEEDDITQIVDTVQRLVLSHPIAAQAAYRALVAEGRRFAGTEEGRAWRARLERSPEVRRLRPLWEASTFNVLDADDPSPLPGRFIDLVAQALSRVDLDELTSSLTDRRASLAHDLNPNGEG